MNYALHTFRRTPSHPLCAWLCFGFSSVWSGPLNLGLVLSAFTICRLLCCTGNISIFTWTTRNLWIGACNSTVKRTSHTETEGLRFVWGVRFGVFRFQFQFRFLCYCFGVLVPGNVLLISSLLPGRNSHVIYALNFHAPPVLLVAKKHRRGMRGKKSRKNARHFHTFAPLAQKLKMKASNGPSNSSNTNSSNSNSGENRSNAAQNIFK